MSETILVFNFSFYYVYLVCFQSVIFIFYVCKTKSKKIVFKGGGCKKTVIRRRAIPGAASLKKVGDEFLESG